MQLEQMLTILDQASQDHLHIGGHFGVIKARPDGGRHPQTQEPTYQVDAEYLPTGKNTTTRVSECGFRFSTVCCLGAVVCMGEDRVDHAVLTTINERFGGTSC